MLFDFLLQFKTGMVRTESNLHGGHSNGSSQGLALGNRRGSRLPYGSRLSAGKKPLVAPQNAAWEIP
jgi:hypothetical protein